MGAPTFRRGNIGESRSKAATPTTASAPTPREGAARPNRYGGKCTNCGVWIEAGQGNLVGRAGSWGVEHIGACPEPGSEANKVAEAKASEPTHQVNVVNGEALYDGIYTLETATAHRTFRLKTQALDDDFMPGKQIVQHLVGADNERDYQSIGHIFNGRLSVWKKHQDRKTLVADLHTFLADPHGEHVVQSINCFRCGRTLTVPASVHNGLGPECAKRGL